MKKSVLNFSALIVAAMLLFSSCKIKVGGKGTNKFAPLPSSHTTVCTHVYGGFLKVIYNAISHSS